MNQRRQHPWLKASVGLLLIGLTLGGCSTPAPKPLACDLPSGNDLNAALQQARFDLGSGCAQRFDDYLRELLAIAEGDPRPENKERFSEFLVWAQEQGLISRQQAQNLYNRYFNVKFVSLRGEYNNCSYTCPRRQDVLLQMEQELRDKEQGLMKVSLDAPSYHRADRLYRETELVLEATCSACSAK